MKRTGLIRYLCALVTATYACLTAQGQTVPNLVIFQNTNQIQNFWQAWGQALQPVWAPQDAAGNTNSGSAQFSIDFTSGGNTAIGFTTGGAWYFGNAIGYLSNYVGVAFDILWDSNSVPNTAGIGGVMNVRTEGASAGPPEDGFDYTISTNNSWSHVTRLWAPSFSVAFAGGFFFYMQTPAGGGNNTGPIKFWIDNLQLIGRTNPPPPPPVMAIEKFSPPLGLRIFSASANNPDQQQHIRTLQNNFTWVNQSEPVTYALSITNFPNAASYPSYQADLFLVPNNIGNESAPYWNETNVLWLQIFNNANGTVTGQLLYKTNAPNGLGNYYDTGTLAIVTNASALGTWTLTMNNNTNITLTTPSGSTTNVVLPDDSLALFNTGQMFASIGIAPHSTNNATQTTTFSHFRIAVGANALLDEPFIGPTLDTFGTWVFTADSAGGIVPLPTDPAYWLTWTLPDASFKVTASTDLTGATYDPTINIIFQDKLRRRALIQWSSLQASNNFFKLQLTNGP